MKALKVILISVIVLLLVVAGLHAIAMVGVYNYSRMVDRKTAVRSAPPLTPARTDNLTPPAKGAAALTYVVQKGDTLVKIARAHGVPPEELCRLNKLDHPDKIQLAQVLHLPVKN